MEGDDMEGDDMEGDDMEGDDMEGDDMEDKSNNETEKRLKKKFAHNHLIDAMRNHENMMKAMRSY
jgi:hypothetical protein